MNVGIIGGGAAGMMAAITAAKEGAKVTILERNDRVGKKILVTGNGKCNLGNYDLRKEMYYGANREWIWDKLQRFNTENTVKFFEELGLMVKDKNGYLYPACEQAAVVLDVLRIALERLHVEIVYDCKINHIERNDINGKISVSDGSKQYVFDKVIVACGSKAAPKTGSDGSGYKLAKQMGHEIVPTVPALVQMKCVEDYFKAVAGVRTDALLKVWNKEKCVAQERGELQLTEYGISGIPVFQLSRVMNYVLREQQEVSVSIHLLPDFSEDDYQQFCHNRMTHMLDITVEEFFTGMLHKKIMMLFTKQCGLKPNMLVKEAGKEKLMQVFALCREWKVTVNGSNPYDNAQVCAGGVDIRELSDDLESLKMPGVYFAGEVIDVDGKCGGYNLQWAWCSGHITGKSAASKE